MSARVNRRIPLILAFLTLLPTKTLSADIDLTTPLGSYYQPGRYLPIRVRLTAGTPTDVILRAEGAVPTVISAQALAGGRAVSVPFLLVTGAATQVEASAAGQAPRSLPLVSVPEGERLVGVRDDADVAFARRLFPGRHLIPVSGVDPTLGPATAWEALDGAVLDHMPEPQRVTALHAMGLTLAVRDSTPPRDGWRWQLQGNYWVLRREWCGPRGVIVPEAYDPPQVWHPGRSEGVRWAGVMGLIIFSLLAIGASLLRPRWAVGVIAGGSVVGCLLALQWRGGLSPVVEAIGAVIVTSDVLTQRDDWIYRRHLEPADGAIAAPSSDVLLKPALASPGQIDRTGIALHVPGASEPPRFTYRLEPGWTLAFRTIRLAPGPWPGEPVKAVTTPMRLLVPLYALEGRSVEGELRDPLPRQMPPNMDRWDALLLSSRVHTSN